MTGISGEATRDVIQALARREHERAVELLDVTAVIRALSGSPAALTALERDTVIVLADRDGVSREITAQGLGVSKSALDHAITRQRRRVGRATRDLWASVARRRASDLATAVSAGDADAVAAVLTGLDCQALTALCVVLADLVPPGAFGTDDGRDTGPPLFYAT